MSVLRADAATNVIGAPRRFGNASAILSASPAAAEDLKKLASLLATGATSKLPAGQRTAPLDNALQAGVVGHDIRHAQVLA